MTSRDSVMADGGAVGQGKFLLRESRQRMFEVMRGDPLDQKALAAAMAEVRTKSAAVQALLQSALAAILAQMPAAERQKIRQPGLDG